MNLRSTIATAMSVAVMLGASIGAPVFALWVARGFRTRPVEVSSGDRR